MADPRARAMIRVAALTAALALPATAPADTAAIDPDIARLSAARMAALGREAGDADILIAALALLLSTGARVQPGDPWSADLLYDEALKAAGDDPGRLRALQRLTTARRGVVGQRSLDLRIAPGATETIRMVAVPGETARVEAWLRRGTAGADVDLTVQDEDGRQIAADLGPDTGIENYRAFAEWRPDACQKVVVLLVNNGTRDAQLVFLAPPALAPSCGG